MFSKDEIKKILTDTSLELSKDTLERMIDEELAKPDDAVDMELIDLCLALLEPDDGAQAKPEAPAEAAGETKRAQKKAKRRASRLLLAAAVTVMAIVTAFTASANLFFTRGSANDSHFNVDRLEFYVDESTTTLSTYKLLDSDFAKLMERHGLTPLKLPEMFLSDDFKITSSKSLKDVDTIDANITFQYGRKEGRVNITKHFMGAGGSTYDVFGNLKAVVAVDDISVYVVKDNSGDYYDVIYQDADTIYLFCLPLPLEQAIEFANSVK